MPHYDMRIAPGAFGTEPQTVPLVIYEEDGTRREVGSATITPQEDHLGLEGHITDPELAKKVGGFLDGFTIRNPDGRV